MINSDAKLADILPSLTKAEWIALDTEADSLHAYPEKLCLLQVSLTGRDKLIDPLASVNLDPLWPILKQHELIMHGADYDLRLLCRGFRFVPHHLFDTMLAARLLGYAKFGLTDLVAMKLGVTLEKGPQKMDWARRPLTARMEQYARNDTHHLRPLSEILRSELEAKGRLSWQRESCARLIRETSQEKKPDPESVWRVRGSDRLDPRGLAVLRELWQWRESEALAANKPPYFILSHEHLTSLAARAAHSSSNLRLPRLPASRAERLGHALEKALQAPPANYPSHRRGQGKRLTRAEQKHVEDIRKQRDHLAHELGIDPSLIASRAELVDLVIDKTDGAGDLMNWQRRLLLKEDGTE